MSMFGVFVVTDLDSPRERTRYDLGHCERCGHVLGEDVYGWCVECDDHAKAIRDQLDDCVCWWSDFGGRSVCGSPCPVHGVRGADT